MTVPTVFVVIGPAGSGKTTVAQRTAKEHGAAYLDKGRMCGRLVEFALEATVSAKRVSRLLGTEVEEAQLSKSQQTATLRASARQSVA